MKCLLFCCSAAVLLVTALAHRVAYNTTSLRHPTKLNVHFVVHSHLDPGWKWTFEEYYHGRSGAPGSVHYIYESMLGQLCLNKDRTFELAEMSFFSYWWEEQNNATKQLVRDLAQRGQLEFANGGWVQHDEACTDYVTMIDQTTRGHRFLSEELGVQPRVGWLTDNFGHSSTQASLMSASVGWDGLLFFRAPWDDYMHLRDTKATEMVWGGCRSCADQGDIFTAQTYHYYSPPGGFLFDWPQALSSVIYDDPESPIYNLPERMQAFNKAVEEIAEWTVGNDILLYFGGDFMHMTSQVWFNNLDKLIHYTNQDGKYNAMYSTMARYIDAKSTYNHTWPWRTHDFLPYADNMYQYWSGYYSSRPSLKLAHRQGQSYLQAARQLEALAPERVLPQGVTTDTLEAAVALTSHHDAVTGTCTQKVADDYMAKLTAGMTKARSLVNAALENIILSTSSSDPGDAAVSNPPPLDLVQCPLLNISVCTPTVSRSRVPSAMSVVVYNQLGGRRVEVVRVPLAGDESQWLVTDHRARPVASQTVPVAPCIRQLQELHADIQKSHPGSADPAADAAAGAAGYELVFAAVLPPVGPVVFSLQPLADGDTQPKASYRSVVELQLREEVEEDESLGSQTEDLKETQQEQADQKVDGQELPDEQLQQQQPDQQQQQLDEQQQQQQQPPNQQQQQLNQQQKEQQQPTEQQEEPKWESIQKIVDPGTVVDGQPVMRRSSARRSLASALQFVGGGSAEDDADREGGGMFSVSNGLITLVFNRTTGGMVSMSRGDITTSLTISPITYTPSSGYSARQRLKDDVLQGAPDWARPASANAGAYVFSPNGPPTVFVVAELAVLKGPTVTEVRQTFDTGLHVTYKLWRGTPYVEVDWVVGPLDQIPGGQSGGLEVALEYASGLSSGDRFWTDANSREWQPRVRNKRPTYDHRAWKVSPVPSNYYPLTAGMFIRDDKGQELSVLVDRPQAGGSLRPGQMELLLHRRVPTDDFKDMGQGLLEDECGCYRADKCSCPWSYGLTVRGTHYLLLGKAPAAAKQRRRKALALGNPTVVAFGRIKEEGEKWSAALSALQVSRGAPLLPPNVHLLTLKRLDRSRLLLRLAHMYELGEHPVMSKPVTIDLNQLLYRKLSIRIVVETSLTTNQRRKVMRQRPKFKHGPMDTSNRTVPLDAIRSQLHDYDPQQDAVECFSGCSERQLLLTLNPMEVRTFELTLGR